jgi:hypothetical protein
MGAFMNSILKKLALFSLVAVMGISSHISAMEKSKEQIEKEKKEKQEKTLQEIEKARQESPGVYYSALLTLGAIQGAKYLGDTLYSYWYPSQDPNVINKEVVQALQQQQQEEKKIEKPEKADKLIAKSYFKKEEPTSQEDPLKKYMRERELHKQKEISTQPVSTQSQGTSDYHYLTLDNVKYSIHKPTGQMWKGEGSTWKLLEGKEKQEAFEKLKKANLVQ